MAVSNKKLGVSNENIRVSNENPGASIENLGVSNETSKGISNDWGSNLVLQCWCFFYQTRIEIGLKLYIDIYTSRGIKVRGNTDKYL